ncbi:hypothetical protein BU204_34250 [Actinophytocola xanthii]|uniref:Uncharacterized protein n=2 Tax=Actinophytocola xanthii TaxID=1912961 RepID=A0A1Q8C2H2_9PSEU|nr:hypothetical protein BU204_34250 [Actinophytocola xanthii]
MSAKRDRKNSIRGWQIPECGQWIRPVDPNPDDPTGNDDGKGDGKVRGRSCPVRATHRVTYRDGESDRTEHACQAHLRLVLDWAAKRRARALRDGLVLPEPTIVELTFTADAHAAAYGRIRFIRSEQVVTGPIAQALIATQSRIPPPPPPRRRTGEHRATPAKPAPVQETLF